MEVPDTLEKEREANRVSYLKHRERRLADRTSRFEDTEERLRKNTFCRAYYWERREEVLAQKKAKWEAMTEEEKEDQRAYQRAYYLKYREEHKLKGKIDRAKKATEKPALRRVGRPPGEVKIKKSKAPKQYIVYDSTDRHDEDRNTLEAPKSAYQRKLLKARCPLGFFQTPESEDPFRVSF